MNKTLVSQLAELAVQFRQINVKPVVCGGLGIFLYYQNNTGDERKLIRVTRDVDLILTPSDLLEQAKRNAIAQTILHGLHYVVREDGKHFRFHKAQGNQELDILAPPVNGLEIIKEHRVRIVKSRLHGHLIKEAQFVEEDLRPIYLGRVFPEIEMADDLGVFVPSPTNMLILKLFAFNERCQGPRKDEDRALAHLLDLFIIVSLSTRQEYIEGQAFLKRHNGSDIIQNVQDIIKARFNSPEDIGRTLLLSAESFYPEKRIEEKRQKLDEAHRRLIRWFSLSH